MNDKQIEQLVNQKVEQALALRGEQFFTNQLEKAIGRTKLQIKTFLIKNIK